MSRTEKFLNRVKDLSKEELKEHFGHLFAEGKDTIDPEELRNKLLDLNQMRVAQTLLSNLEKEKKAAARTKILPVAEAAKRAVEGVEGI